MKETIQTLVLGKGSACMVIEHSEVFKSMFSRHVKCIVHDLKHHPTRKSCTSVRHLRACKVRFESCTKPMGRFIMYLPAVLSTLIEAWRTKSGKQDGKTALEHLSFIDNERLVMLALLADAGDESLMLARYYDTGTHDPGSAVEVHEQYRMRIDYLFVQGNCWRFGYTRHALTVLQSTYVVVLARGSKTIGGGVSDDILDRCLQRMRSWVYLATCTIQAEFPKWDVTHCLSVFRLDNFDVYGADGHGRQTSMARLAQVLGLSASKLKAQIDMIMPFAANIKGQSKGMTTIDAWRAAITRLSSQPNQKFWGKVVTLKKALLRACAWQGCVTSGVEQMFSRVDSGDEGEEEEEEGGRGMMMRVEEKKEKEEEKEEDDENMDEKEEKG
eukprot:9475487-Pyramimonas_sp.AAC.1